MNKILTAEEFVVNEIDRVKIHNIDDCDSIRKEIARVAVEFSKLHVELALKSAKENVSATVHYEDWNENGTELIINESNEEAYYSFPILKGGKVIIINEQSILNAYPLTNIK